MSTITKTNFGQISFKTTIAGVGSWEVCLEMQYHGWKKMKIYKR
jgi:hypothetical protein